VTALTLPAGPFADFTPAPTGDMTPPPLLRAPLAYDGGEPYPVDGKPCDVWLLGKGDYLFEYSDTAGGSWARLIKDPEAGIGPDLFVLTTASGGRVFVNVGAQVYMRHASEVILSLRVVRCLGEGCSRTRLLEPGDQWVCPDCDRAAVAP
jgi:hypothetical protein